MLTQAHVTALQIPLLLALIYYFHKKEPKNNFEKILLLGSVATAMLIGYLELNQQSGLRTGCHLAENSEIPLEN